MIDYYTRMSMFAPRFGLTDCSIMWMSWVFMDSFSSMVLSNILRLTACGKLFEAYAPYDCTALNAELTAAISIIIPPSEIDVTIV